MAKFSPLAGKSQTALLLDHFRTKPSISPIEAAALFRIRSLSRRVNDLEEKGHLFMREPNTDTTGQRYVRYHYIGKVAPQSRTIQSPGSLPPSMRGAAGIALAQR